jgi:hypothetical protein
MIRLGIAERFEGGASLEADVAIFFETESFSNEPGKGVEHARMIGRIPCELSFPEELENLSDGRADDHLVEIGFIRVGEEIGGEFVFGVEFVANGLLLEPVEVTAGSPVGDVLVVEVDTAPAESFNDDSAGYAVGQHLVEFIALVFGEFGDFAVSVMGQEFKMLGQGRLI